MPKITNFYAREATSLIKRAQGTNDAKERIGIYLLRHPLMVNYSVCGQVMDIMWSHIHPVPAMVAFIQNHGDITRRALDLEI